jgi:integrase
MAANSNSLLTVAECARRLNVSECWVRRHLYSLPVVRLGRLVRVDADRLPNSCVQNEKLKLEFVADGRSLEQAKGDPMFQRNRRYQAGSVYLYKGKKMKTWYGMFRTDVIDADGKLCRKQQNVRLGSIQELPTKRDACNALRALLGKATEKPVLTMTFADLFEKFAEVRLPTMKKTTASYYEKISRGPITKAFGPREIGSISRFDIESFLMQQSKKYSWNSLHGMKITLSQVFSWAVACDWLEKNPVHKVKLPRVCGGRTIKRRVLTTDEVISIIRGLHEPYATLVLFLYVTGLRIGEAAAIKWSDFEGDRLRIQRRISDGDIDSVKTRSSERLLPIPEALLARMKKLGEGEWVFRATNGSPVNQRNALKRYVRPRIKELGIEIGGWHDFRHSLSTSLRRDHGVHPKVVAGILGHSDSGLLAMKVYDHLEAEEFRLPLDQMLRSVTNLEASA